MKCGTVRSFKGVPKNVVEAVEEIHATIAELIATGERNFLWYWRNPLVLQWRRGVRGLEYSTLAAMIGAIRSRLAPPGASRPEDRPALPETADPSRWEEALREIKKQLTPFCEKAKRLLIKERLYMMNASLSPVDCPDAEIGRLRQELFAAAMSHGGDFKRLIDPIDRLLYDLIKGE